MTPEEISLKAVDCALSFKDLCANPNNPDAREAYLDAIAPGETESMKKQMATMSGCGLIVAAVWRLLGVKHYKLDPPYIVGTAVSRLVTLARKVNAWVPFKTDQLPNPGDMVLIGDNGAGGVEHVYTVTSVTPAADGQPVVLESIDGGQRDLAKYQLVLAKKRVWRGNKDIVFTASDPGSAKVGGRKIYGHVDVTKLPLEET